MDDPSPGPRAPLDPPDASAAGRSVGQQQPVPAATRSLSTFADPGYVDAFVLTVDAARTWSPEQWARAMFGDVPSAAELVIWRGLLGLRLARHASPDTVAGWRIARRAENWLRLEASSWFVSAHLVVRADETEVSLATFIRYDRLVAAFVWPPLAAVHRRLVPGVLLEAHRRLQRDPT